ncbi:hypothetical protein R3P38DRAFT_3282569 [Favolaschia claudopus]|uniref:Uncharacterized protein n=1 Tax=Favolaschia claudopus TaxID=2862362 RepID=A0AAW0ABJ3_9AGAR
MNNGTAMKQFFLQLQPVDALVGLYSMGIISRTCIFVSRDSRTAYLCDLECKWGSLECPEITDAYASGSGADSFPTSKSPTSICSIDCRLMSHETPHSIQEHKDALASRRAFGATTMHEVKQMLDAVLELATNKAE